MSRPAVSTYASLWREDLDDFCASVAGSGFDTVEVLAAPPQVDLEDVPRAAATLRRALERHGLSVSSVVPSGVDVNLASVQDGMRRWSCGQFVAAVRLAALLGAPRAVVHPGRRHPLRPPEPDLLRRYVVTGVQAVLRVAEAEGVQLLVENVPTGLLDTVEECVALAEQVEGLQLCYDVANGFMVEDVAAALAAAGSLLGLVHLSDTAADRWRHDPLGSGEVPLAAVVGTLRRSGYDGPVVLETLHDGPAGPGFERDLAVLGSLGLVTT